MLRWWLWTRLSRWTTRAGSPRQGGVIIYQVLKCYWIEQIDGGKSNLRTQATTEKLQVFFCNFLPRTDACPGLRLCERRAVHHVRRGPPQAPGQQHLLRRRQREVRGWDEAHSQLFLTHSFWWYAGCGSVVDMTEVENKIDPESNYKVRISGGHRW